MGDKTQVATLRLAPRFDAWAAVVTGTTLRMMPANAPGVWFGERITRKVPGHTIGAVVFVVFGVLALWPG